MFTNVVFVENLAQCRAQLWVLIAAHNSERTLPHSILDKYGICWKCSSILPTYLTYLLACDLCHNKFTLKRFLKTHIHAIQASATKNGFFTHVARNLLWIDFWRYFQAIQVPDANFLCDFLWHTWLIYLTSLPTWPNFLTYLLDKTDIFLNSGTN